MNFDKLPNELIIKIFGYLDKNDLKKVYFYFKNKQNLIDFIAEKRKYNFIYRLECFYDISFSFSTYREKINKLRSHNFYENIVDEIYKNEKLSLVIWKNRCNKYGYFNPFISQMLEFYINNYRKLFELGFYSKEKNNLDRINNLLFCENFLIHNS